MPTITNSDEVIVRMYRHGLGACYLIILPCTDNPEQSRYMLIDCGVHKTQKNGIDRLARVMADIVDCTGGKIDVLAVSHQHADHISGFVQNGSPFLSGDLTIDSVWLPWTELPADARAIELRRSRQNSYISLQSATERIANDASKIAQNAKESKNWMTRALKAFELAKQRINAGHGQHEFDESAFSNEDAQWLADQLENDEAFKKKCAALQVLSNNELAMSFISQVGWPEYCRAGEQLRITDVDDVLVHVLGPSTDFSASNIPFLAYSAALETEFFDSLPEHMAAPFNDAELTDDYECILNYVDAKNAWRTIDSEWLGDTSKLADTIEHDIDSASLVLAIELGEPGSGDVLLFTGDAPAPNWQAWEEQQQLIERTLIYKVGRNGAEHATPHKNEPIGLGLMNNIIALINIDKSPENRANPVVWNLPHQPLYEALREKSNLRVLRSDDEMHPLPDTALADKVPMSTEWTAVTGLNGVQWRREESGLYYDISIKINR